MLLLAKVTAMQVRLPPWRQPRGKSMVSLVNSHSNASRIGWYLWEINLRFAPGANLGGPGWDSFYSFYLERISVFCQPMPLPRCSGVTPFVYLLLLLLLYSRYRS